MSPRFSLAALACALLLGFGFYLQYVKGLEPCPLCLIAALHRPRRAGAAVYAVLAALFALGGAAVAGRQVWLQHLPPDKVPQCGPDLFFMVENFPLSRTLKTLFSGTGECAAADWPLLRPSIAEWSLVCFAALFLYSSWLVVSRSRSR